MTNQFPFEMKICFKCKVEQSVNNFYAHPQMADGHLNKCKICTRKDVSKNYLKNRDYYVEYEQRRNQTAERRSYQTRRCVKNRKAYPKQCKARDVLGRAVRDQKVIKPEQCQQCGKRDRIHGHHEDYEKPLEVVWLCARCHFRKHRKLLEDKILR